MLLLLQKQLLLQKLFASYIGTSHACTCKLVHSHLSNNAATIGLHSNLPFTNRAAGYYSIVSYITIFTMTIHPYVGENIRLGLGENIRLGLEGYLWVKDTMTVTLNYPDWIHVLKL